MSENTPENNNENLDQEEQQDNAQGKEQNQNGQEPGESEIHGEQVGPEDTPEEVKEEARKLGKGEPDAYYKISEEEYEKMKKHVPEDLQKTIASSKIKNGTAPQCWLPAINGLAFGLIAFVPGLNIAYGAVLLANLKILPMLSAKKVENSAKSLPSSFKPDNNDKKQQFGTRKTSSSPSFFGSKDNNQKQSFGSKDDISNSKKQSFGSKSKDNEKQDLDPKDNNVSQPFGSKGTDKPSNPFSEATTKEGNTVNFGTAGTNPSPELETKEGNAVKFGTTDSSNSVLDSLKKINQSFGTGKSSSSPAPHAEKLEELKQTVKKPPKVGVPSR